jgi:zinc transporter ZupT
MRTLLFVLMIVLALMVSLALFIGLSLGIGSLLTLFLPFSLFEATLLSILAAVVTGLVWYGSFHSLSASEFAGEEDEPEPDEIPESRFWKSAADRTWEAWFRYMSPTLSTRGCLNHPQGSN